MNQHLLIGPTQGKSTNSMWIKWIGSKMETDQKHKKIYRKSSVLDFDYTISFFGSSCSLFCVGKKKLR